MKKKQYKKYILSIFLFTIVLYMSYLGAVYFFFKYPKSSTLWINNLYKKKLEYSKSIEGRKIILIGGSNVLFGISAKRLEKKLGIPVLNLGTHGALGAEYLLYRAKRDYLNPGDIVLLSLEYRAFLKKDQSSAERDFYIMSYDKEFLKSLSLQEKFKNLRRVGFGDFMYSIQSQLTGDPKVKKRTFYNFKRINVNGDQIIPNENNIEKTKLRKVRILKQIESIGTKVFDSKIKKDATGFLALDEFIDWCKQSNITVYYEFCPMGTNDVNKHTESVLKSEIIEYLKSKDVKIVNTKIFYDIKYLFDTKNHLNNEGRKIRTQKIENYLINELKS